MATQPRDAASVICVRPLPDGAYEVLLTRRPSTMRFMGGMYVFPGGAVDESDALAAHSAITPEEAADRLAEDIDPQLALALHCAAVRETFEEAGILLARTRDGRPVDGARVAGYLYVRDEVARDGEAFAAFCATEGLVLATDLLVPHARLVTPEMSPIRFDARFFVTLYPEVQAVVPHPSEVDDVTWVRPSGALALAGSGDIAVAIPTMAILQGLAEVADAEQVLKGQKPEREVVVSPLSPLVTCVLAPNPGLMTGPGTNSYVVGSGEVAVVDPAVDDAVYIERVTREALDRGTIRWVLLTHTHPDHVGGAAAIVREYGCELAVHEGGADRVPGATRLLRDGDRIEGLSLDVLHTPGHASDHVCYLLAAERALFAGDVLAGLGTVVIAPPDGNMEDYLATLRRLRSMDLDRVYPGHGPLIVDPAAKLDEYVEHRLEREGQVLDALGAGLDRVPDMVARIYTDVPKPLHAVAELSVRAHLEMLERQGRVRREGERWVGVQALQ